VLAQAVGHQLRTRSLCLASSKMAGTPVTVKKELGLDGTIRPYCVGFQPSQPDANEPQPGATDESQPAPPPQKNKLSPTERAQLAAGSPTEQSQPAPSPKEQSQPALPDADSAKGPASVGWYHKVKFMPENIKEEWDRINALKRHSNKNELKRKFKEEALACPGTAFESEFFSKFRKVQDQTTEGSDWQWVSWHKLKSEDGEAVALEMTANGSVVSRPHKNLTADTKLKWPDTHEFRKVTEKGSNFKIKTEGMLENSEPSCDGAAAFEEAFQKMAVVPKAPHRATKEKSMHAQSLGSLKESHRKWDELSRAANAQLTVAEASPYVAEQMKADLKAEISNAKKCDKQLVELEMQATNGKVFNESDGMAIKDVVEMVKAISDKIKKLMRKIKDCME
jgi:hypothetical protein